MSDNVQRKSRAQLIQSRVHSGRTWTSIGPPQSRHGRPRSSYQAKNSESTISGSEVAAIGSGLAGGIWRHRRPLRYVHPSSRTNSRNDWITRPNSSRKRSRLISAHSVRHLKSATRRRFLPPKRIESIDILIDSSNPLIDEAHFENAELHDNLDKDNFQSSGGSLNLESARNQPLEPLIEEVISVKSDEPRTSPTIALSSIPTNTVVENGKMTTNELTTNSSVPNSTNINHANGPSSRLADGIDTRTKLPPLEMGKSNRVADSNVGLGISPVLGVEELDKNKGILQRFGITRMIPNNEEYEEYKRGRLKYLHNKLVIDSNEAYFYYWAATISTVYVYNLIAIARSVFVDLDSQNLWLLWLILDLISFLEQGLLVRDVKRIKQLYYQSRQFRLDVLSVFPVDYLCLFLYRKAALFRFNRLLRRERLIKFMEHTETRSSYPNAFRVGSVVWYIAVIIHWNACFYFLISETIGLGSDTWVYGLRNTQSLPDGVEDTLARRYIYSFYWSTLILTTIGEVPGPQQNIEFAFVTMDLMCGVLIFATIVGNVGSMISNMGASRTEFQNRMDGIKQYMELRRVSKQLEVRVIKWFDYLWANKQSLSDQQVLEMLPNKLQAEIAMHVHFETLRKVRIFQDCEAGLLAELVLKLQLQVFSPMDYVCRKGDIGREMYIVKRGMLQVVADDGNTVFATLSEGAVFGELSILNIQGSKNGNRRTANVRSVGYTDLFVLNKNDLWNALREYPEARKILIHKGRELLRKDNLLDETAPEESKTAEEIADELQASVRILQTRLARLMAEHMNSETKMRDRIEYLESKLSRYHDVVKDEDVEIELAKHKEEPIGDEQVEEERQQLLRYHPSDSDTD
ncbi:hypothetical protein M3Y98_00357000 [Aphelenchoides besseyi]|nr:hypothetical protein M3Y98_00357000 [Aphelenchoides besseyi]